VSSMTCSIGKYHVIRGELTLTITIWHRGKLETDGDCGKGSVRPSTNISSRTVSMEFNGMVAMLCGSF
jgi:hypothetical protein